jgi:hypothetical protein
MSTSDGLRVDEWYTGPDGTQQIVGSWPSSTILAAISELEVATVASPHAFNWVGWVARQQMRRAAPATRPLTALPSQPLRPPPPPAQQQPHVVYVQRRGGGCLAWISGATVVIIVFFTVFFVAGSLHDANTLLGGSPTATDTPFPTFVPGKANVVLDMAGNGIKESATFSVQGSSQLLKWTCDPNSGQGYAFNVQVYLYDASTKQLVLDNPIPVNALCGHGSGDSTGDTSALHLNTGSYYIEVNSEGSWHVTITDQP